MPCIPCNREENSINPRLLLGLLRPIFFARERFPPREDFDVR
jgi:hypothetical protein